MIRMTLSSDQKCELEGARRHRPHIAERCHEVLLSDQGFAVPQVAKRLGRDEQTVRAWLKAYQRDGIKGLVKAPTSGRLPLKGQALDQQLEALLAQSPADVGYLEAGWSVDLIGDDLAKPLLSVSDSTVRRYLQAGGWVYKRFTPTVATHAPHSDAKKPGWQTWSTRSTSAN
jgi:transposase